jgi:hypothetical protein
MIRIMLLVINYPKPLWSEVAKYAAYIKYHFPHKSLQEQAQIDL